MNPAQLGFGLIVCACRTRPALVVWLFDLCAKICKPFRISLSVDSLALLTVMSGECSCMYNHCLSLAFTKASRASVGGIVRIGAPGVVWR